MGFARLSVYAVGFNIEKGPRQDITEQLRNEITILNDIVRIYNLLTSFVSDSLIYWKPKVNTYIHNLKDYFINMFWRIFLFII